VWPHRASTPIVPKSSAQKVCEELCCLWTVKLRGPHRAHRVLTLTILYKSLPMPLLHTGREESNIWCPTPFMTWGPYVWVQQQAIPELPFLRTCMVYTVEGRPQIIFIYCAHRYMHNSVCTSVFILHSLFTVTTLAPVPTSWEYRGQHSWLPSAQPMILERLGHLGGLRAQLTNSKALETSSRTGFLITP
jgi:hypothetical protein